MDNHNRTVNLSKPASQPWTDPVTGEIYPGGNPNEVSQPTMPQFQQPVQPQYGQPASTQYQQPFSGVVQPNSEIYPNPAQQQYNQPVQPQYGQPVRQDTVPPNYRSQVNIPNGATKFCSHCGGLIAKEAIICPACGCQVEQFPQQQVQQPIIINNNNNNNNVVTSTANYSVNRGSPKNKWVALVLCFFLGWLGVHRFYENKIGTGLLYFFTGGLFGIGVLVDFFIILFKPNPYYV